jgi:transcription antitermination factor NusG
MNLLDLDTKLEKDQKWYVAYTMSRQEKKVFKLLEQKQIKSFLPLKKSVKQWSDRKKIVEEPLFTSYVFVHIDIRCYYNVVSTSGVVRFIKFNEKPIEVKNCEIEKIKKIVENFKQIEVNNEKLLIGDRVLIIKGYLKGIDGILVEFRGKKKVAIKIDSINLNLLIDLPLEYIKKI